MLSKSIWKILFLLLTFITACENKKTYTSELKPAWGKDLYVQVKNPWGTVSDYAGLFDTSEINSLDSLIRDYNEKTTAAIVVLTLPDSFANTKDFEKFTLATLNSWGVGTKEKDNGILVGISTHLRILRVENGYGIEKILSNEETKKLIDSCAMPRFKESKFYDGTRDLILGLINKMGDKIYKIPDATR